MSERFIPKYAYGKEERLKRRAFEGSIEVGKLECVCCGEKLRPLYEGSDEYKQPCLCGNSSCTGKISVDADSVCVHDAVIAKVHAGYGSDYDTCTFMIGLCDNCLESNLKAGRVVMSGTYM